MGLIGSILARKLHEEGIEFSWEDTDSNFCAWKASTGCVYPSGNTKDAYNYSKFEDSATRLGMEFEVAEYCFSQNSIPHKENDKTLKISKTDGFLKFLNKPSYHVNVQQFVENSREIFKQFRNPKPENAFVINAHGYHQYFKSDVRWGWSCTAKIELSNPQQNRICFNLKEGRFINVYLYPKPGTNNYYFGTSFIFQNKIKELLTAPKVAKSVVHAQNKIQNFASIELLDDVIQGWRPAYSDDNTPDFVVSDDQMFLKPQMANGVRHHISFFESIMPEIRKIHAQTD